MLAQAQQTALAHGGSALAAKTAVIQQLYGQVRKAAVIKGFDDCFFIVAVSCLLAVLPTLLISKGASGEHAEPVEV